MGHSVFQEHVELLSKEIFALVISPQIKVLLGQRVQQIIHFDVVRAVSLDLPVHVDLDHKEHDDYHQT